MTEKRKIKFRAIYKPDKDTPDGIMMFYVKMLEYQLYFVYEQDEEIRYPFDVPFFDDDWEILQYTGLKDKNGLTDIYEGDIIGLDGNIKGNIYETKENNKRKTDLVIQGFGKKEWMPTYQKAMECGCKNPE